MILEINYFSAYFYKALNHEIREIFLINDKL